MAKDILEENKSVAIIGAGIAGLAIATGLKQLGIPFTIYEQKKR